MKCVRDGLVKRNSGMVIANCGFYHTFRVSPTFCHYLERINHRGHNRKDGAFEIE